MILARTLIKIGLAILFTTAIVSCATYDFAKLRPDRNTPVQPASDADRHSTYSNQLQAVMNRLQKETIDHWPETMADERAPSKPKDSRTAFAEARPLAEALASAADEIPRSVSHLVMLEADRRAFTAQAETLRDQARRLSAAARNRDREKMQQVLDSINNTCQSCHARFLDVSGPLSRL